MAHTHTFKDYQGNTVTKTLTMKKAIVANCQVCLQAQSAADCSSPLCPLFPFRQGKTGVVKEKAE